MTELRTIVQVLYDKHEQFEKLSIHYNLIEEIDIVSMTFDHYERTAKIERRKYHNVINPGDEVVLTGLQTAYERHDFEGLDYLENSVLEFDNIYTDLNKEYLVNTSFKVDWIEDYKKQLGIKDDEDIDLPDSLNDRLN